MLSTELLTGTRESRLDSQVRVHLNGLVRNVLHPCKEKDETMFKEKDETMFLYKANQLRHVITK